jgi:hypothetical protein
MYPKSNDNLSDNLAEIPPATTVQRRLAPLPKSKKRPFSRSSSISSSVSDYAKPPPPVATSPVRSPRSSLSNYSVSDRDTSTPSPKAVITKKRKLKEIKNSKDLESTAVKEKSATSEEWEPVDESYSRRKTNNRSQYRCTLCLEKNGKLHLSNREGDMARHLQSLMHTPKSFFCPNSGCSSTFTRQDALKRHLNKCVA